MNFFICISGWIVAFLLFFLLKKEKLERADIKDQILALHDCMPELKEKLKEKIDNAKHTGNI